MTAGICSSPTSAIKTPVKTEMRRMRGGHYISISLLLAMVYREREDRMDAWLTGIVSGGCPSTLVVHGPVTASTICGVPG